MEQRSIKFRKDPKKVLKDMIEKQKYDTCHEIEEYDATQCAQDCEALAEEPFAKNCSSSNGLYKCCIR